MKEEFIHLELVKNEPAQRFEMDVGAAAAVIGYKQTNDKIYLIHTEVPQELEGKGVATAIIEKTLDYVEKNHLKLVPLCPFVVAYIKRHPGWKKILDESVKNI
jgi:uncharacterized protein